MQTERKKSEKLTYTQGTNQRLAGDAWKALFASRGGHVSFGRHPGSVLCCQA